MRRTQALVDVVLIEDEDEVRDVLGVVFDLDDRFRVVAATGDGLSGIAAVAVHQPDVVVVDMQLPGASGVEVIEAVRRMAPATRIVVFSCFPDPFTLLEVLRLGADSYLDKATAWMDLLPTIAELCGLPGAGHPADA